MSIYFDNLVDLNSAAEDIITRAETHELIHKPYTYNYVKNTVPNRDHDVTGNIFETYSFVNQMFLHFS